MNHPSLLKWYQDRRVFTHKAAEINYLVIGQGEPLLMLHGFPTCSWDWHKIAPDLKKQYQLICPDFIGFGMSDKPVDYEYSFFDQADIIEGLIKELAIKSCKVMAHDYGDTVLQELMARQNENSLSFQIEQALMLNGGLFPGVYKPRLIQKIVMGPFGSLVAKFYTKKHLRKTFHNIFGSDTPPSNQEMDAFWEAMVYKDGKKIIQKVSRYQLERKKHEQRWGAAIENFQNDFLLVLGVDDPISGGHMGSYYEQNFSDPKVTYLEGIGHYPQTEAPAQVLKICLNFFNNDA